MLRFGSRARTRENPQSQIVKTRVTRPTGSPTSSLFLFLSRLLSLEIPNASFDASAIGDKIKIKIKIRKEKKQKGITGTREKPVVDCEFLRSCHTTTNHHSQAMILSVRFSMIFRFLVTSTR
jgi:hypothetical protein